MDKSNRKSSKPNPRKSSCRPKRPATLPAKAAYSRERVVHYEMFDWLIDEQGRLMDAAGKAQLATVMINAEIGTDADRHAFVSLIESAPILWRLVYEVLPVVHGMIGEDRAWGQWYVDAIQTVLYQRDTVGFLVPPTDDQGLLALRTGAAGFEINSDDLRRADHLRTQMNAKKLEEIRLLGDAFGVKAK